MPRHWVATTMRLQLRLSSGEEPDKQPRPTADMVHHKQNRRPCPAQLAWGPWHAALICTGGSVAAADARARLQN